MTAADTAMQRDRPEPHGLTLPLPVTRILGVNTVAPRWGAVNCNVQARAA